jgi:hypothetical protein
MKRVRRSKGVARESVRKPSPLRRPSGHAAVVYSGPFPYEHVREVIDVARLAKDSVILMLLAPPRRVLRRTVRDGPDVVWVSTETASRLALGDGKARKDGLVEVLGPALDQARRNGTNLRLVTDVAGHLCMIGREKESHAVEALCSAMCRASDAKLLCIYPVEALRLRGPAMGKEHHVVTHLGTQTSQEDVDRMVPAQPRR